GCSKMIVWWWNSSTEVGSTGDQLLDGRQPTGGSWRPPTEKWLVIDPLTGPPVRAELNHPTFQRSDSKASMYGFAEF
ncbi:putative Coiled-coil and C2 domain-containing protein, partial [Naja naja]